MAFKSKSQTINDKEVVIVLVGALEGIKITTQLAKVVLPAISAMQAVAGEAPKGSAVDLMKTSVTDIVSVALENADAVDLDGIIKKLFNGATVNDFPIKPDDYFSGNYGELIDFMAFALEANFGSFFEAAILSSQSTGQDKKTA
ncbi:hypothetical protein Arno162_87 [Pectobacterium phage Arno162]|uniref:Uncharacterized protein n=2 Tax=Arnovirus TaxID=3425109 RepID=A0A678ZK69_9CAUD|nr:hypothetical protein Arno162_87 [Pectobacterium phage Arno162]AZV02274.1 hypothetical protein Arno18_88 [Pectobacterium phage Arno18]